MKCNMGHFGSSRYMGAMGTMGAMTIDQATTPLRNAFNKYPPYGCEQSDDNAKEIEKAYQQIISNPEFKTMSQIEKKGFFVGYLQEYLAQYVAEKIDTEYIFKTYQEIIGRDLTEIDLLYLNGLEVREMMNRIKLKIRDKNFLAARYNEWRDALKAFTQEAMINSLGFELFDLFWNRVTLSKFFIAPIKDKLIANYWETIAFTQPDTFLARYSSIPPLTGLVTGGKEQLLKVAKNLIDNDQTLRKKGYAKYLSQTEGYALAIRDGNVAKESVSDDFRKEVLRIYGKTYFITLFGQADYDRLFPEVKDELADSIPLNMCVSPPTGNRQFISMTIGVLSGNIDPSALDDSYRKQIIRIFGADLFSRAFGKSELYRLYPQTKPVVKVEVPAAPVVISTPAAVVVEQIKTVEVPTVPTVISTPSPVIVEQIKTDEPIAPPVPKIVTITLKKPAPTPAPVPAKSNAGLIAGGAIAALAAYFTLKD